MSNHLIKGEKPYTTTHFPLLDLAPEIEKQFPDLAKQIQRLIEENHELWKFKMETIIQAIKHDRQAGA